MSAADATGLETESCSRCGGTGSYSWCQAHGSTCFKCGGKGRTYTKRGAAAARYLELLRSKRLADVVVGDKIWMSTPPGMPGAVSQWILVERLAAGVQAYRVGDEDRVAETIEAHGVGLRTKRQALWVGGPDTLVRVAQTAEQKAATYAQAVAYQSNLTKNGTPRKARGAKEA